MNKLLALVTVGALCMITSMNFDNIEATLFFMVCTLIPMIMFIVKE